MDIESHEKHAILYQYCNAVNIPIFISFFQEDFDYSFEKLLLECNFVKIDQREKDEGLDRFQNKFSRVLKIENMTRNSGVKAQIGNVVSVLGFDKESINFVRGNYIYRYAGESLLLYSFRTSEWKLAVTGRFGDDRLAFKIIVNRYLALAISHFGIIGLWGRLYKDGVLVSSKEVSEGLAQYIDVLDGKLISSNGIYKIRNSLKLYKLDGTIVSSKKMKMEELYGLLAIACTFLHYKKELTVPIRQMILSLSKNATGYIYAQRKFNEIDFEELHL